MLLMHWEYWVGCLIALVLGVALGFGGARVFGYWDAGAEIAHWRGRWRRLDGSMQSLSEAYDRVLEQRNGLERRLRFFEGQQLPLEQRPCMACGFDGTEYRVMNGFKPVSSKDPLWLSWADGVGVTGQAASRIVETLKFYEALVRCSKCLGEGCPDCHGRGFVRGGEDLTTKISKSTEKGAR